MGRNVNRYCDVIKGNGDERGHRIFEPCGVAGPFVYICSRALLSATDIQYIAPLFPFTVARNNFSDLNHVGHALCCCLSEMHLVHCTFFTTSSSFFFSSLCLPGPLHRPPPRSPSSGWFHWSWVDGGRVISPWRPSLCPTTLGHCWSGLQRTQLFLLPIWVLCSLTVFRLFHLLALPRTLIYQLKLAIKDAARLLTGVKAVD